MKTIGLIGGMSWESSKIYYEYINNMTQAALGGSHSSRCILISVDFAEIEKLSFENNWDAIGTYMEHLAKQLQKAGADVVILCTNTIHLVSKQIEQALTIPFIHIAHVTGKAVRAKGFKKVSLLGTRFTMEKTFYTQILSDIYDLEVVVPKLQDRKALQHIIYNELVKGVFSAEAKVTCLSILKGLEDKGVQGHILGCTELPILLAPSEIQMPSFDTTALHAQAAVNFAISSFD